MARMKPKKGDKVIRGFARNPAYWTAMIALVSFNLALALFATIPLINPEFNIIEPIELGIIVTSLVSVVLLILHMFDKLMKISRYAFFGTLLSTSMVFIGFVFAELDASPWFRIDVMLFLFSGWLISTSMHIVYGGKEEIAELLDSIS